MDDNIQAGSFFAYLILYVLNIFNSHFSEQLLKSLTTKKRKKIRLRLLTNYHHYQIHVQKYTNLLAWLVLISVNRVIL